LDTFGAQVSSDHERYPADVKCLGFLYLYVGRYPRNNASRNTHKLRPSDMLPEVRYVESGVAELVEKQTEGWSYVRP
ncbi:MAG: hypothetical protein BECKG1743D_GA0114223_110771, partial [Candidatus Kentron sp. G]